jgi:hypothetical protein
LHSSFDRLEVLSFRQTLRGPGPKIPATIGRMLAPRMASASCVDWGTPRTAFGIARGSQPNDRLRDCSPRVGPILFWPEAQALTRGTAPLPTAIQEPIRLSGGGRLARTIRTGAIHVPSHADDHLAVPPDPDLPGRLWADSVPVGCGGAALEGKLMLPKPWVPPRARKGSEHF